MIKTLLISLGILALLMQVSWADELTGRVVDSEKHPIAKATVQTNVTSQATETDDNGYFILKYDKELPEYFTVSHISFQPRMIPIDKYVRDMTIMLAPAVYPGQKIKVTAMRAERGVTPSAFSDLTEEDIDRDYTVADFPMLIETTPNLYSYSYTGGETGASDFKIRGFDYKRIGVYVNGVPLNDPEDRFTYFYDL